jgi:hypothetical protein
MTQEKYSTNKLKKKLQMNSFKNLYLFILLSTLNNIYSQNRTADNQIHINVSDKMTTHLIFDETIDYVDIGANEFSTDKLKNVLKIKCTDLKNWNVQDKTNLTVITKGGNYYSIWITYQINPKIKTYIYNFKGAIKLKSFDLLKNEKIATKHCDNLNYKNSNIFKKCSSYKMKYMINGIFYEKDKIIFRLKIKNDSKIIFSTDSIRFLLTTKKKFNPFKSLKKLNALQYTEKNASFICNGTKNILGNSNHTILFGFDRFVPTKNEVLEIRIAENNSGGRRGKIVLDIKDFLFEN